MQKDVINQIRECEAAAAEKFSKAQFEASMLLERARADAEERYNAAEEAARKKLYDASAKAAEEARVEAAQAAAQGKRQVAALTAQAAEHTDGAVALVVERITAK
ncbi:MAG: hypothetical protein IJC25_02055 [Clostridia bacterium]|nr:hypothetical protein [Clostridia bacterium]